MDETEGAALEGIKSEDTKFDSRDWGWVVMSIGMAVGAGIVFLPVEVGIMGIWVTCDNRSGTYCLQERKTPLQAFNGYNAFYYSPALECLCLELAHSTLHQYLQPHIRHRWLSDTGNAGISCTRSV